MHFDHIADKGNEKPETYKGFDIVKTDECQDWEWAVCRGNRTIQICGSHGDCKVFIDLHVSLNRTSDN